MALRLGICKPSISSAHSNSVCTFKHASRFLFRFSKFTQNRFHGKYARLSFQYDDTLLSNKSLAGNCKSHNILYTAQFTLSDELRNYRISNPRGKRERCRSIIYKNTAKQKRGFIVSRFRQISFKISEFPHDGDVYITKDCTREKLMNSPREISR